MLKEKINDIFKSAEYDIKPKIPDTMLIELSNRCNNLCIFCANSKMTRKKGEIDFDFLKRILKEARDLGVSKVGFYTTGEPLIYNRLGEAVTLSKKLGFEYIYITTNGILAKSELIEDLVKKGLNSIKFSINAINANDYKFIHRTDNFNTVINNLKNAYKLRENKKLDFKLFVSYIATKYTEYDVNTIREFFKPYCDEVAIVNVRNQSGLMPIESEMLSCKNSDDKILAKRTIPCYYLFKTIIISYEGYLTGCCTDFQNYLAYADLNKNLLKDAWTNAIITNLRKQHLSGAIENNLCNNCITNSIEIPQPLNEELSTRFEKTCFCEIEKFYKTLEERKENNGNSRFIK